tara:strand:- start:11284 stop:13353 length:2070 start_codon:yes stop_codon:yes gene_type:complete
MASSSGILRIVSPEELQSQEAASAEAAKAARSSVGNDIDQTSLRQHIDKQWHIMRDHRSSQGLNDRLLQSLRVFNGKYDNRQLGEIMKFGGSTVYSRIVGTKARGATALLRDIYFSVDRPWSLKPTPDPKTPEDVAKSIPNVVQMEAQAMAQAGQPITPEMVKQRIDQLQKAAKQATLKNADKEAKIAERKLDDYLVEGGFYQAFQQFMTDLPLFPFAVIKGPIVQMVDEVVWEKGAAVVKQRPKLIWERVSPFDFYFSPGVSDIANAETCERMRWTRKNLNDLLGLPGWNEDAVRGALSQYDQGLRDWMDPIDSERSTEEEREDPNFNRTGMIDAMAFNGNVTGKVLREWGMPDTEIKDPLVDYHVQAWICGHYVLKVQVSPSPRKRHPYFVTSFEKVPGTPVGNSLVDMLADIQEIANASLRNLVNNMGMSSGPQVVVMDNRFAVTEETDEIYPWKRWHMADEPGQGALPPVSFYQPNSNAAELLGIYQKMTEIADEISAIPRYATGSGASGGAGRTASGLSMLMGNASKVLQQVAANIDMDVLDMTLKSLYDLIMLTSPDTLRGDESIMVKGVSTVMSREAERARQLEFLQLTANPIDMQIMGVEGRSEVLRSVADDLGMPVDRIVPTQEMVADRQKQMLEAQQAQAQATGEGDKSVSPGIDQPGPANSTSPVENTVTPGHNTGGI